MATTPKAKADIQRDAEEDILEERSREQEAAAKEEQKRNEKEQEDRKALAKAIVDAGPDGYEVTDKNQDAVAKLVAEEFAFVETTQTGKGGLDTKQYAYLSKKGEGLR